MSYCHRYLVCGAIGFLLLCGCTATGGPPPVHADQQPQQLDKVGAQHHQCKYLLYLPDDYVKRQESQRWPLIVFLHGGRERGDDLALVKQKGLPKILEDKPDFPFVVVSPQCPAEQWWDMAVLSTLLDEILSAHAIDPDRVYLTGQSAGGFGTWQWAARQPERFAAIAPICGGGDRSTASRLKNLPVWAFHGAEDTVIAPSRSQEMVDAINKAGGSAKLTIYPDATHDVWTRTYDDPELYSWFLAHRRGVATKP